MSLHVDLSRRCFRQRCFDPECRKFRSSEFAIPNELFETPKVGEAASEDRGADEEFAAAGWSRELIMAELDEDGKRWLRECQTWLFGLRGMAGRWKKR